MLGRESREMRAMTVAGAIGAGESPASLGDGGDSALRYDLHGCGKERHHLDVDESR